MLISITILYHLSLNPAHCWSREGLAKAVVETRIRTPGRSKSISEEKKNVKWSMVNEKYKRVNKECKWLMKCIKGYTFTKFFSAFRLDMKWLVLTCLKDTGPVRRLMCTCLSFLGCQNWTAKSLISHPWTITFTFFPHLHVLTSDHVVLNCSLIKASGCELEPCDPNKSANPWPFKQSRWWWWWYHYQDI